MSTKSKILFLGAFLALIGTFAVQVITGAWLNLNSVLLGLSGALVVLAVVFDWKLYWEFFTMRTTKHGMNMGLMIILVITLIVCLNYLANRHNKTWDLTHEKLNSLSEQSSEVLRNAKDEIRIKVFYKGAAGMEDRQKIKQNLELYQDASNKIKVQFLNSYVDTEQSLKYLNDQPDKEASPVFVFVEYKEKKVRAEQPYDEAAFTSAMIKATREGESKIYFIKGHGEKDLEMQSDQGLSAFASSLGEASFKVEGLSLIERKEIPKDAAVVAIVGPQVAYLEEEMKWLREYYRAGGKLFIALDPGQRQNLANLTKTLGVEFQNNYILTRAPLVNMGPAAVIGFNFDPSSEITRGFPTGASFAIFPLASELKIAPTEGVEAKELVKTDPNSFVVQDASKPIAQAPETQPVLVAVSVKADKSEAVVFGDSDFITNRALALGINRDLAMNAIAQLAQQKDLLSIRPKLPKGSMIVLTSIQRFAIVIGGLSLPLILFIASGVMWFRRRGA